MCPSESSRAASERNNQSKTTPSDLLEPYNMHGWRPDPSLSDDENFMEATLLVTRNACCLQGFMGCIVAKPTSKQQDELVEDLERRLLGAIVGVCTNMPLYTDMDSDIHAEIGAIGQAARLGNSTDGCTAYITMPPCKTCFGALVSAGIKRIVSEKDPCSTVANGAQKIGVEMVILSQRMVERKAKLDILAGTGNELNAQTRSTELQAEIEAKRKRRKESRQEKKRKKRDLLESQPSL